MSRPTLRRAALGIVVSTAGIGLLVWQIRRAGTDAVAGGLAQVGWGFLALLAFSLARFALRSLAWTTLMGGRPSLAAAVGATLAGDAVGNLTPLSLLVSEPVKALYLRDLVPGSRSFAALTAENFFYSVSVAVFIILGTAAMLVAFAVPDELRWAGLVALAAMAAVLAAALWLAWQKPALASAVLERLPLPVGRAFLERVRRFESSAYGFLRQERQPLSIVLACEAAFHVLSFAEAYLHALARHRPVCAARRARLRHVQPHRQRRVPGHAAPDWGGRGEHGHRGPGRRLQPGRRCYYRPRTEGTHARLGRGGHRARGPKGADRE